MHCSSSTRWLPPPCLGAVFPGNPLNSIVGINEHGGWSAGGAGCWCGATNGGIHFGLQDSVRGTQNISSPTAVACKFHRRVPPGASLSAESQNKDAEPPSAYIPNKQRRCSPFRGHVFMHTQPSTKQVHKPHKGSVQQPMEFSWLKRGAGGGGGGKHIYEAPCLCCFAAAPPTTTSHPYHLAP